MLKSTNDTLDASIHLKASGLKQHIDFACLESFVVAFYYKDKVPPAVKNLAQLRWYLFSKNQFESQMPHIYGALHEKVLRAHYTALQWKSEQIPSPLLPDMYGWKWDTEMQLYGTVMAKLLPAQESIIELFPVAKLTGILIHVNA